MSRTIKIGDTVRTEIATKPPDHWGLPSLANRRDREHGIVVTANIFLDGWLVRNQYGVMALYLDDELIPVSRKHREPKYLQHSPKAAAFAELLDNAEPGETDFYRCSGLVDCLVCGHSIYQHPPHPIDTYLLVTCHGYCIKP